jgi:hypothetical protein
VVSWLVAELVIALLIVPCYLFVPSSGLIESVPSSYLAAKCVVALPTTVCLRSMVTDEIDGDKSCYPAMLL